MTGICYICKDDLKSWFYSINDADGEYFICTDCSEAKRYRRPHVQTDLFSGSSVGSHKGLKRGPLRPENHPDRMKRSIVLHTSLRD